MAIRCTVFFWEKHYFKNININTTVRGEESTIVLKSTLKFLFAERIKERKYSAPKVFTNHQNQKQQQNTHKPTIITLQKNSYWENIGLMWATIGFSLLSVKVLPFYIDQGLAN